MIRRPNPTRWEEVSSVTIDVTDPVVPDHGVWKGS